MNRLIDPPIWVTMIWILSVTTNLVITCFWFLTEALTLGMVTVLLISSCFIAFSCGYVGGIQHANDLLSEEDR
jgi:hypothetical protein